MIAGRQWQSLAEVMLCSGVPTQLALSGLALLAGLRPATETGGMSLPFIAIVTAADTVLLGALILWFLRLRNESPARLFLGTGGVGREVVLGLALAPLTVLFMGATMWGLREFLPQLHTVPDNPLGALARSPVGAAVMLLVAMIAGGVREEVQRAFLLHRFRADLGGPVAGLAVTSLAFGIGHLLQGWDAAVVTALLGAFWGLLFLSRGSMVAAMLSHALANGAQVLIAFSQAK